jgi:hypothetical protein
MNTFLNEGNDLLEISPESPATAEETVQPEYIDYTINPDSRKTLEHFRGVLQSAESNMSILSNLSGIDEGSLYRIHKTGEMTPKESENIANALKEYERQTASLPVERVPGTGEIMLEEEEYKRSQTGADRNFVKGKQDKNIHHQKNPGLPNRPQLFKIFNSFQFSRLKNSEEYVYVYNNQNTNLRLVVKTGLKDRPTAKKSTEFEAFQPVEAFIYDLETNSQIKALTRTALWNQPNVSTLRQMNEIIWDLLLEVHYRPYCPRHRQSMKLVTPFANPNRQFWGCEHCKAEGRKTGRENIRGVLTIENYKKKIETLDQRIAKHQNQKRNRPAEGKNPAEGAPFSSSGTVESTTAQVNR